MSLRKNLVYNIILTVSNMIFPIISFPYAARVLGPEGIGEVSFAQTFCEYFILAAALGIPTYGVREIAKLKNNSSARTNLFFEIVLIRIATSLAALIPYLILIFFFTKFSANIELYLWGALLILINVTSIEWFFIGLEDFKYITIRSILTKLIAVVLLFLVVKERTDIIPYFLITLLTVAFNGFFNIKHASKYLDTWKLNFQALNLKKHLRPLILIFGGVISIAVYTLMDTFLLGVLVSSKSVGLYSAATKITKISLSIITSLSMVLVPKLSFAAANGDEKMIEQLLDRSFDFVYSLGIPMTIGVFILAPELIFIFSGHEFEPAVTTLRILSPLIIIIGMASIFSNQILNSLSKDSLVMRAAVIGAIASVMGNLISIPFYQENGSAFSNLFAEIVVTTFVYIYARKFINFKIKFRHFLNTVLICIPFFAISYIIHQFVSNPLMVTISIIFACGFFYVSVQTFWLKNKILLDLLSRIIPTVNLGR